VSNLQPAVQFLLLMTSSSIRARTFISVPITMLKASPIFERLVGTGRFQPELEADPVPERA
jgi:hypothetical protein